jgi:tetratricopeptide (TPR) repeat protein
MRLAAATLVPLLLLGVLELGLRLAGFGHSTRLFLPRTIGGEEFLIPNEKFTHRFFPPALARAPLSGRMAAHKPEGTYRIFLLGESAAYGDPDPSFGVGRYLEALLEARYPKTDFEVVCAAITAINSHVILPIARECARHDGDLWVVYMGNNEMIGPFGAGTVFGEKAPRLAFVRTVLALKTTRVGQLVDQMVAGVRGGSSAPESWDGINMFSKNQLRYDDPKRLRAYENFRTNLADILSVGKNAGVPIVLSTVAVNLRDCSPFASLHAATLEPTRLSEWDRLFKEALALEAGGSFQAALDVYGKAAAIDSDFAELQFRIGTCQLAIKNHAAALKSFEFARDHDALAVRADTRINRIITEAVQPGSALGVDAVQEFSRHTPDGIPGKELFYEHVHFTMAGNELLARLLAAKIAGQLPASITANGGEQPAEIEAEACKRRLAATVWDQKRVWDVALGRISGPPFTSQSSHPRNLQYCKDRMKEVDSRTTPQSPIQDQKMYEAALAAHPDDTLVRWNYAQFFERTGRLADAAKQGEMICERLPHAMWPHYFTGSVMARLGKMPEAADYLQRALRISPDFPIARKELEQIRRTHPSAVKLGN